MQIMSKLFIAVLFKPLHTTHVRQMLYREVLKHGFKSVTVWTSSHQSNHYRMIILKPCIAHHRIVLVVERIEYLNSIEPSYSLNPYILNRLVKRNYAPVACMMGYYCAEVILAVYKLNSGLDIVSWAIRIISPA